MNVIDLHRSSWDGLQARRRQLPHALLLAGQRGLGKLALAQTFAASLLCESPTIENHACGRCLPCNWQAQGNHPDFRLLQPDALSATPSEGESEGKKASKEIRIDQVRALDDFLTVGTHRTGLRIILVYPAEAMNRSTANALLKSLEEPAPSTLFLLVTDELMRLLPTIRSRCQTVPIPLPDSPRAAAALQSCGIKDAEKWLALAGGAPFLARKLAEEGQGSWLDRLLARLGAGASGEPLASAEEIDKLIRESKGGVALRQVLEWAQKWLTDLSLAAACQPVRYFTAHEATIARLATQTTSRKLVSFYRQLVVHRRAAEQPLNARLFLEAFFLDYRGLFIQ